MAGYFIVNFTIHDPEKFEQYWNLVPNLKDLGIRHLVRERDPIVLQGEPHQIIAVLEFESVEAAKRWYASPEYKDAVPLWVEAVEGWAVIAGEIHDLEDLNPSDSQSIDSH